MPLLVYEYGNWTWKSTAHLARIGDFKSVEKSAKIAMGEHLHINPFGDPHWRDDPLYNAAKKRKRNPYR